MVSGINLGTMDVLVKFTMSREKAEAVKRRFEEMSSAKENISYMDCVVFDAALGVLGLEKSYYGVPDDEWEEILRSRRMAEERCAAVKTIDITDVWREVT